jgi:pyrimidine-nucleoside phosphorylase
MRAVDIITSKRDRQELTAEQIGFFVRGLSDGSIPDYQVSAWAMAVQLNGMTPRETADLALAMAHSGEVLDLSHVAPVAVDKHSTGGVGDKTSLVVLPVVAASGLPVAKMSGRGLGFSGGTLDKLESIPGYRVDLSTQEFERQLREIGVVLCGQSPELAPADGKLYALRDVTGTVPSIPLIASSVMSKKIAGGAQAIVLDVKVGKGAFMETLEEARQLAAMMTEIAERAGRQVVCLLSSMDQPLGAAVGNALEVREAIDTLRGRGPDDFREHCLVVASHMLVLGGKAMDLASAQGLAEGSLAAGEALAKFRALIQAQGGDVSYVDDPVKLPRAKLVEAVEAPRSGYLSKVDARTIGEASVALGAGRARKSDPIDHAVGFEVPLKVGDQVERGGPLFTVHASSAEALERARAEVLTAFDFSEDPVPHLPLFFDVK